MNLFHRCLDLRLSNPGMLITYTKDLCKKYYNVLSARSHGPGLGPGSGSGKWVSRGGGEGFHIVREMLPGLGVTYRK